MKKNRIQRWLDANSNYAVATRVTKTTQQVATAIGISKQAAYEFLIQLASQGNAIKFPQTTGKKIDRSWSTVKVF